MNIQGKAMADVSKAQESSVLFDFYVQRSLRLCDMHGVGTGSPKCLPDFVQRLIGDPHFAMDFWAMTRSLTHSTGDRLSEAEVASLLISCVGGSEVDRADDEQRAVMEEFATLLAEREGTLQGGEHGGWAAVAQARGEAARFAADTVGSSAASLLSTPAALTSSSAASSSSSTSSAKLEEALSRLELNGLELKLHLDNLDSRMSRIEPHLEDITSLVAASVAAAGRSREVERERRSRELGLKAAALVRGGQAVWTRTSRHAWRLTVRGWGATVSFARLHWRNVVVLRKRGVTWGRQEVAFAGEAWAVICAWIRVWLSAGAQWLMRAGTRWWEGAVLFAKSHRRAGLPPGDRRDLAIVSILAAALLTGGTLIYRAHGHSTEAVQAVPVGANTGSGTPVGSGVGWSAPVTATGAIRPVAAVRSRAENGRTENGKIENGRIDNGKARRGKTELAGTSEAIHPGVRAASEPRPAVRRTSDLVAEPTFTWLAKPDFVRAQRAGAKERVGTGEVPAGGAVPHSEAAPDAKSSGSKSEL